MKKILQLFVAQFLSVQLVLAAPMVTLSWQDNSNNETGFRIQRAEGSNAFTNLTEVAANATAYQDTAVVNGRTYQYRVLAFNNNGNSAFSNTVTITVNQPTGSPPQGPLNLELEQPGEFVNVSVRGPITATDTTIIPSFVVSKGSAWAFIRVVGPTLGQPPFNVPDVSADPQFTIVRTSDQQVVGGNNDWTNASYTISNVTKTTSELAVEVGAFALPAGSKDAVAVVKLPPGNYSIVCRGTAGIALAEVYKIQQ